MIKRSFFLLTFICLASPVQAIVGDISHNKFTSNNTYTHTPIELKPASFLELDIPSLKGAYKTASVCFLGDKDCAPDANVNEDKNSLYNKCIAEGYATTEADCEIPFYPIIWCPYSKEYYKKCGLNTSKACESLGYGTSCATGQIKDPDDTCEYNSSYFKCKCDSKFISCSPLQVGSGASCGGKYEICSCDSNFFKYNFLTCQSPKILGGTSCESASTTGLAEVIRYSECKCPKEQIPVTNYGCKEYYPAPCDSVCKTYYTDNCHNREEATGSYGCESYWSDCPGKCQTAYADNCRNRIDVPAQYGCETYWADCSKKCQTAFPDNCHNKTAITVPANAVCSSSYSDCSSKCSAFQCNTGYELSGNTCIEKCPNPYIIKEGLVYECETNTAVGFVYNGEKYLIKNGNMGGVVYNPCTSVAGYELPTVDMISTILSLTNRIPGVWIESNCTGNNRFCFYWTREECSLSKHMTVNYSGVPNCKDDTEHANFSVCVKQVD